MKDNNRGLTLVELLVTIAILGIVLVIATSFMVTGSRSFTSGNADTTVQKEAELAVNQMEDMVIDVNGGVDMLDDSTKTELILYNAGGEGGAVTYTKEAITWDKSAEQILCSKWNVIYDIATDNYVEDSVIYSGQLLAEHVTGFQVDLSDFFEETAEDGSINQIVKSVQFKVAYESEEGHSEYATSPIITLRNRMMKSASPKRIFDSTPTETDTLSLYISETDMASAVPIQDRVTEVERARTYNVYAMINSGANVNNLVDWTIEETKAVSTISSSGQLSVGEYEPCAYLTITASYKSNPNKKVSGVVKVVGGTLKSLEGVSIVTKSLTPFAPQYGSIVSTIGFTDSEIAALSYTWTVSAPERVEPFVGNTKNLSLQVKQESQNYGKNFTITLKVYSAVTGQTVSDSIVYRIDEKGTTGGDSNLERGKASAEPGNHSDVWFGYETPFYPTNITTEYYFCDQYGEYISALDFLKPCVVINVGHGSYNVTFTEELPPDHEYYLKVIIHYELRNSWQNEDWSYERIHYIPAVSLYGVTSNSSATLSTGYSEFWYNVEGYYELAWKPSVYEYTIEDLEYEAPDGVSVTAEVTSTQTRTESLIWGQIKFNCNDWSQANNVKLKSMKIKINLKSNPDIYTYSTVIFN